MPSAEPSSGDPHRTHSRRTRWPASTPVHARQRANRRTERGRIHGIRAVGPSRAGGRPGAPGLRHPARRVRRRADRVRSRQVHQPAGAVGPVPGAGPVRPAARQRPPGHVRRGRRRGGRGGRRGPPRPARRPRRGGVARRHHRQPPAHPRLLRRRPARRRSPAVRRRAAAPCQPVRPAAPHLAAASGASREHRVRADRRRQPGRRPGRDAHRPARPRRRTGPAGGDLGGCAQCRLPRRARAPRATGSTRSPTCGGGSAAGTSSLARPRRWLAATVGAAPSLLRRHRTAVPGAPATWGYDLLEQRGCRCTSWPPTSSPATGRALTDGPSTDAVLASAALPGPAATSAAPGASPRRGGVGEFDALRARRRLGRRGDRPAPRRLPCAGPAPSTAVGTMLTALSLILHRQLLAQVRDYDGHARQHVLPPLCPLFVSPADFSTGPGPAAAQPTGHPRVARPWPGPHRHHAGPGAPRAP